MLKDFIDQICRLISNENSCYLFFLLALCCSHTRRRLHLHKGCIDNNFSTPGILVDVTTLCSPCGSNLIAYMAHSVLAFVELLVKVTPDFSHQPDCSIHCCCLPAHWLTHTRTHKLLNVCIDICIRPPLKPISCKHYKAVQTA